MSRNMLKTLCATFFVLGLFTSIACNAHGGGGHGGGGWHGGGGGWHGGGGGWHGGGGGWHGHGGGYYYGHGGGYYGGWGGSSVVIGVPYGDDYYAPACQTVRVCNNYGHCWLQDSCY